MSRLSRDWNVDRWRRHADRQSFQRQSKGEIALKCFVMDELDAVADAAEAGLRLTVSSAENVLSALREGRLVRRQLSSRWRPDSQYLIDARFQW